MLKRFIPYYKPHLKLFALDMLCALLAASCGLVYPMVTRAIINDYVPNKQLNLIVIWSVILLLIYGFQAWMQHIMQFQGHVVGVRMQADMRRKVFAHLHKMPFSYFDEHKTGTIMSRIINDLQDISEFAHHGPEDLFISAISIVGAFIILCNINVLLTCIIFMLIPLLIVFVAKQRVRMRNVFAATKVEIAEVNATLENSIAGVRVSRAFTGQDSEQQKYDTNNGRFLKVREQSYRVMADFGAGTNFILSLLNLAMLFFGGIFVYNGAIDVGDFLAYVLYIGMFTDPIKRLVQFVEMFQNASTGFNRFDELISSPVEEEDPAASVLSDVKGHIVFDNVTFHYEEEEGVPMDVLHDVSIDFPAGKMVAIVGPSGGGKTTLCHLIPRFYEISGGSISIDGKDIRDVTRQSLRQNIGIVQQDVFLFTGTIYDNIAYGRPDATKEEVYEAAKRANIHDYIMTLEHGYDTFVGERGIKLSGGQKQRISIARVFLKNPPILILDEATSALDNVTENMIQEALDELCKGRTTIVVAHRLSTVKNADEIIVISKDGIQERGQHEELLNKPNGIYANLYQAQFARL